MTHKYREFSVRYEYEHVTKSVADTFRGFPGWCWECVCVYLHTAKQFAKMRFQADAK